MAEGAVGGRAGRSREGRSDGGRTKRRQKESKPRLKKKKTCSQNRTFSPAREFDPNDCAQTCYSPHFRNFNCENNPAFFLFSLTTFLLFLKAAFYFSPSCSYPHFGLHFVSGKGGVFPPPTLPSDGGGGGGFLLIDVYAAKLGGRNTLSLALNFPLFRPPPRPPLSLQSSPGCVGARSKASPSSSPFFPQEELPRWAEEQGKNRPRSSEAGSG